MNYTEEQMYQMTVKQLKDICRDNNYKRFSKLNKAALIAFIHDKQPTDDAADQSNSNGNNAGNQQTYTYLYKHRGFSMGCQPSGFVSHDDSAGKLGSVTYNRPLTDKEINDYELIPYNSD